MKLLEMPTRTPIGNSAFSPKRNAARASLNHLFMKRMAPTFTFFPLTPTKGQGKFAVNR